MTRVTNYMKTIIAFQQSEWTHVRVFSYTVASLVLQYNNRIRICNHSLWPNQSENLSSSLTLLNSTTMSLYNCFCLFCISPTMHALYSPHSKPHKTIIFMSPTLLVISTSANRLRADFKVEPFHSCRKMSDLSFGRPKRNTLTQKLQERKRRGSKEQYRVETREMKRACTLQAYFVYFPRFKNKTQ